MRYVEDIHDLWEAGGPFVGENRPSARVTVEKTFQLRTVNGGGGKNSRGPYRWFQREDTDDQIETEVPNVRVVSKNRSVDTDAATCEITIANTKSLLYGEAQESEGVWGKPGFFSFGRGQSQEGVARWGQVGNEWANVFSPNALLRTYEGYGGHDLTIEDAVAAGDLVLTGVWMIDRVQLQANGDMRLSCRDMGKLLLEQQLYTPLVPGRLYPLEHYRFKLDHTTIPDGVIPSSATSAIGLACHYGCSYGPSANSSTDVTRGADGDVLGHKPSHAFDSSPEPAGLGPGEYHHQTTFWLSNSWPSTSGFEWIEMCVDGQDVNKVYIHPWGGNYVCYISVWENGGWVSPEESGQGGVIPYSGPEYTGDNAADIPYVHQVGVKWEGWDRDVEHFLPRTYRADKIRLTFTNLTHTNLGGSGYRVGIRKCYPAYDPKQYGGAEWQKTFTCFPYPKVDSDVAGYWQVRQNGNVYAFGDARIEDCNSPWNIHTSWVVGGQANHDGVGYWTIGMDGRVLSYGSANWYGDRADDGQGGYVGIAPTTTGLGYWILHRSGAVYAYGDATNHGDSSPSTSSLPSGVEAWAVAIESHPSADGIWVLWSDGTVDNIGSTTHYGDADRYLFTDNEYVSCLRRTSTGAGYWIVSGSGWVKAFGDATYEGSGVRPTADKWVDMLVWDFVPNWNSDNGYSIQRANGVLEHFGDQEYWGSVAEGTAISRSDGTYLDYVDIVRELIAWSGFYLKDDDWDDELIPVYAALESTGAYSKHPLPREMFDKVPVMNPITELKNIVGYLTFVDSEGRFRFESPNFWSLGNYDYDGEELDLIPVIDERKQLLDYTVTTDDVASRSEIIVSTVEPTEDFDDTITTRVVPQTAGQLRGMVKPAQWINGMFLSKTDQEIMAELISMHIWFAQRRGSVRAVGNPLLDINDQVRIYERTTGETYVHYITSLSTSLNNESGEYTMDLETNWLGGTPFITRPLFMACAPKLDGSGYWQVRNNGDVYAFGDADLYATDDTHRDWVVSIRPTVSGDGYWTLDLSGKVIARGDAVHYGDLSRSENDIMDFAITPTGLGYWILGSDGVVYPFGDATDHGGLLLAGQTLPSGEAVICHSIESHPTDDGYWILNTDGEVNGFGALTTLGDANRTGFTDTEYVAALRRTLSGDGYWIVSGSGIVQAFGDATDEGNPDPYPENEWPLGLVWDFIPDYSDGTGYALQHADGSLDFYAMTDDGQAFVRSEEDQLDWALVSDHNDDIIDDGSHYQISSKVREFLEGTESKSALKALNEGFGAFNEPTQKG